MKTTDRRTVVDASSYTDEQLNALAKHARKIVHALGRAQIEDATLRAEAETVFNDLDSYCWHVPPCARGERCDNEKLNRAMREEAAVEVRFTHWTKTRDGGDADPEYIARVDVDAGEILSVVDTDGDDSDEAEHVADLLNSGQLADIEEKILADARAANIERKAVA